MIVNFYWEDSLDMSPGHFYWLWSSVGLLGHLVEFGIRPSVLFRQVDGVRDLLHRRHALLLQDVLLISDRSNNE